MKDIESCIVLDCKDRIRSQNSYFPFYWISTLGLTCVFFAHVSSLLHHLLLVGLIVTGIIYKSDTIFRRLPVKSFFVTRLLFIIWAGISVFWATYFDDFLNRILVYSYALLLTFLLFLIVDRIDMLKVFISSATIGAILLTIYILYYSGFHILRLERLENEAMSINTAATKVAYVALMQFVFFLKERRKRSLFVLCYLSAFIVFTGSKTAFIMLLLGGLVFYIKKGSVQGGFSSKIKGMIIAVILFLITITVLLYVPAVYEIIGRRLKQFIEIVIGNDSIKKRLGRLLGETFYWLGGE